MNFSVKITWIKIQTRIRFLFIDLNSYAFQDMLFIKKTICGLFKVQGEHLNVFFIVN